LYAFGGGESSPADRNSSAGCFVKRSAELFGKGARRRQIEKAPAVINLPVSECSTSKSQRDVVQLVKTDNLTVQLTFNPFPAMGTSTIKGYFASLAAVLPARANDISRLGKREYKI